MLSSAKDHDVWDTRPGKRLQFANLKMAIEIVDLPNLKMVIFQFAMLDYQRVSHTFFLGISM